ncbi:MAG: hypothetical protein AAFU79_16400 [Myxococcota bacterium]
MTNDPPPSDVAKLVQGSVRRHVLVQTAPMIVALIASTSVGILDAYFVGQLGPDALAAIGFVFPVHIAALAGGGGHGGHQLLRGSRPRGPRARRG